MEETQASIKHNRTLSSDAARARAGKINRIVAWTLVIYYNLIGIGDIISTVMAIESGAGYEANPIMRAAMDYAGHGWIAAKLALQGVISFMVLWFPHWIVLGFFAAAATTNGWVVYNNFVIAGVL